MLRDGAGGWVGGWIGWGGVISFVDLRGLEPRAESRLPRAGDIKERREML